MPETIRSQLSLDEQLRILEQMGFQVQGKRRIRDVEEDLIAKLEAIDNDTTYVAKVQHLKEFYTTAYPYVTPATRAKIDQALETAKANAPSFRTSVENISNFGPMLSVNVARAHDSVSRIPLDSAEHFRILMQEERENAHWRIYDDLIPIKGEVEKDLEAAGIITRAADRTPMKVDLDLEPE